jgi:hypothetical protein
MILGRSALACDYTGIRALSLTAESRAACTQKESPVG